MKNIFGKKLGQYILLDHLGVGGMAQVYNALDARIERNVAIKVILPTKRSSEVFLEQFEREARALANLTHTNIVKVLDYGIEEDQPYLVMEYVPGGTLKQALQEPLDWSKAAEILAPIARALDYVHTQKIVHRDVKPSNILLDDDDRPMLSDFGVVKLIETEDQTDNPAIGVGVGTPDYMSPEQGLGRTIDFRADIYSLGIVYYEMITGSKPYTADTPMAVVIKHTTDEFPLPRKVNKDIPRVVEQAILRAVQKDPQKRYASMGEFAQVLEWIALGENAPRKKLRTLVRPVRQAPREFRAKRMLWPALVLVGMLLGTLIASDTFTGRLKGIQSPQTKTSCETGLCTPAATATSLATPTQPFTPTSFPPTPTQPAPTSQATPTPSTINLSGLTLQGTPPSGSTVNTAAEIARWGIGGINQVTWSPDGSLIAIGTTSGIFIYETQTYQRRIFIDTNFNTLKVVFSPDGKSLAAGGRDGQVNTWNVDSGRPEQKYTYTNPKSDRIRKISAVSALSYSPDGKNLAVGYENGAINYFSVTSETPSMSVEQSPSVKDLAISADGKSIYVSNDGNSIIVWSIASQKPYKSLNSPAPVSRLRFSRDHLFLLASGEESPNVYLWDVSADRLISGFSNLGGNATDFDFSSDNQWIAISTSNGEVKIFVKPDISASNQIQKPKLSIQAGDNKKILTLAYSPARAIFATGNWEEGLKVWDTQTGENIFSLNESVHGVDRIYLSRDAQWLASGHDDQTIRIWRVSSAKTVYQFDGYLPPGLPFSPDNRYLVTIHPAENQWDLHFIRIVDLKNGAVVADLPGYLPKAFVQFTDDSRLLVMGTTGSAIIWDVSTWERVSTSGGPTSGCGEFFSQQDNRRLVTISDAGIFFEHTPFLVKLCGTNPRGAILVYYLKDSNTAYYVLGNGNLWKYDQYDVSNVAMSTSYPFPEEIFIAGYQEGGWYATAENQQLLIHGQSISMLKIPGQDDYQYKVAFSPKQAKMFALGSKYGSIHIWALP